MIRMSWQLALAWPERAMAWWYAAFRPAINRDLPDRPSDGAAPMRVLSIQKD
jgi:hypothetical protein